MHSLHDADKIARIASVGAGTVAAGIGGYHLLAWLSGAMTYRGFETITMKTNTALALFLAAAAVIIVAVGGDKRFLRVIARTLACIVMSIGLLTLLQNMFGVDFGIDQMLAYEPPGAVGFLHPNRMGPPGVLTYTLAGASLLLLTRKGERCARSAQLMAILLCTVSLLGMLGYLYGVKGLYGAARFTVIALPATIGNFFLGLGLLLARPMEGLMGPVNYPDVGGTVLRRLLPAAVIIPVLLGWLRLQGEWHGLYETYYGTVLLVVSSIVIFFMIVYKTGTRISRFSAAERKAQEEVQVQRQLLESVIHNMPAGVFLAKGDDLRIVLVNPQYQALAAGKDMLGKTVEEVWPEIQPWFGDIQRKVAATGVPHSAVDDRILLTRAHDASLEERFFTWSTVRVPLPADQGWGVLTTAWETTERKRAEEDLRTARDLLNGILEGSGSNVAAAGLDLRILAMNAAFRQEFFRLFLVAPQIGDNIGDIIAHLPEEQEKALAVWRRAVGGESFTVEQEFGLEDRRRFFEIRFSPIRDADGALIGATQISADITARKQAEEALRASEAQFRAVFEQAAVGIARVSFAGARWMDVNQAFVKMLGYSIDEMLATPWPEVTHPDDVDLDLIPFRRMAVGELETYDVEKRFIHKDGHHVWARLTLSLVRDALGRPAYEIAIVEDITERKRAEDALRESEARFRGIFENAAVGISLFDRSGHLLRANAKLCETLGYSEDELRGLSFERFTPPEDHEPDLGNYALLMRGELSSYTVEKRYIRKDGKDVWVRVTRSAQPGPLNRPEYSINMVEDIGARKQAENELRHTATLLRTVTENTPDFIFVKDRQGRMLMANPATLRDLGKTMEEVAGLTDAEFLGGEAGRQIMENDRLVMERGETLVMEEIPHPDGNRRIYLSSKSPFFDEKGNVIGLIGISRDITDLKRAGEERERLLAELQRSNQDLQQFAYVASHDLQEPLRMVSSYMQLLDRKNKDQLDEKARMYIHHAVDGTIRMQNLIDGLLSYSRISRKKELAAVDANAACAAALANLEQAVRESAGEVTVDSLPSVNGEPVQLVQLFQNLIGNALKYRKPDVPSRVRVSARRTGDWWTFAVSDNGIGIEPQHRDRVFQIFQRLHTKEEYPGTGIGLASCKKIVERHGGRIWFESTPGEGSTFYFTLPAVS